MLGNKLETLWNNYLQAEKLRARGEMLSSLQRFIDELLQLSPEVWHQWAKAIAAAVSDHDAKTPVRFPLFHRVLLPALVDGVLHNEPGCLRWLALLKSNFPRTPLPDLPSDLQTTLGLLMEAVHVDPTDKKARKALVSHHASYLQYTLHELPSGVLYGPNGASLDQCAELQSLLSEFRAHVAILGEENRYADLIRKCTFHYAAYAEYLRAAPIPGGYQEFLSRCRAEAN